MFDAESGVRGQTGPGGGPVCPDGGAISENKNNLLVMNLRFSASRNETACFGVIVVFQTDVLNKLFCVPDAVKLVQD